MVRPYEPRALVLATLGNGIGYGYNAKDVMEILVRVINWAQADFPGIKIFCFSGSLYLKGKDQIDNHWRIRNEYNQYLEAFCARTENCTYVPLYNQALYYNDPADIGHYDKVREDIYCQDGCHFNPKGYALFMDFVRGLLEDLL